MLGAAPPVAGGRYGPRGDQDPWAVPVTAVPLKADSGSGSAEYGPGSSCGTSNGTAYDTGAESAGPEYPYGIALADVTGMMHERQTAPTPANALQHLRQRFIFGCTVPTVPSPPTIEPRAITGPALTGLLRTGRDM